MAVFYSWGTDSRRRFSFFIIMPPSIGVESHKIFFGGLFLVLVALTTVFFLTNIVSADVFGLRAYLRTKACEHEAAGLPGKDGPAFLSSCNTYSAQQCKDASQCAGLPCDAGFCLVKSCKQDSDCPSNISCGLDTTPFPRLCTVIGAPRSF